MFQEELTEEQRLLAAELDGLAEAENALPPPVPDIPDFEALAVLGGGGMGMVYVARQVSLDREIAVKVVPAAAGGALPDEARTVAQLHHPNIVQVFSAGGGGGSAWFAMELVEGESADRHVFASAEEVARLGEAAAEALSYAHRCGILHRDVKPSNLFVGADGRVKLGDFGLACLAAEGAKERSGTKRYMAPEVLSVGKATEASDQYALGVTLRELAERLGGDVPRDFAAICAKASAEKPAARYGSVDAMLADLRRFLAHAPVAANPPSLPRRFGLFARRNPAAACGIAAAAVLLAAFVAALAAGYVRTGRALAETERARTQTAEALAQTEREAAEAAQSLAAVLANPDRGPVANLRETELDRAIQIAESLLARFPEDETIREALQRLHYARERYLRYKSRMQDGEDGDARP